MNTPFSLAGWLPYQIEYINDSWLCYWLYADKYHINEPFFDETIAKLRVSKGSRYRSCTSVEFLLTDPFPIDVLSPNAFIFHVSRCGSTLLSQCLAANQSNIVIAEAPIFDQVLRMDELDKSIEKSFINALFLRIIDYYGQKREGCYKKLFIKLDSWHTHFYSQIRALYTLTPFYFLIREPKAIIKSHILRRGIHAIPTYINPKILNILINPRHFEDFNFYTAEVLTEFYRGIIWIKQQNYEANYFFDYSWGVKNMLIDFYEKIIPEEVVGSTSLERLNRYSKDGDQPYSEDGQVQLNLDIEETALSYSKLYNLIVR